MRIRDVALITVLAIAAVSPVRLRAAEAGKPAHRPIYRCQVNGVTTFSDRACGDAIEQYRLEFDNAAQPSAPVQRPESKAGPEAASRPAGKAAKPVSAASRREACDKLDLEMRKVRSQMRAGYNVKEGERLKERLAGIQERRKAQKC